MYPLIIAGCCLLGSVISGTLGWMKSGGPFVPREFLTTVLSGVGAALVFALAYNYTTTGITVFDIIAAIAAGAGVDVGVNRVSGAIAARAARK
jgi:hypothetical protein